LNKNLAQDQSSKGTCASPVEDGDGMRINDLNDEKEKK
jgi:hypothetical protein